MIASRVALLALVLALACAEREPEIAEPAEPAEIPATLWVEIGGHPFELELALDEETRYLGLSGRTAIAPDGGMLFVSTREQQQTMVMRDCLVPIDVAFLDMSGTVVAVHQMRPELPRKPGESPGEYASRLKRYSSGVPAGFAIETAGGRLEDVDLKVGDRVVFDVAAALEFARRAERGP